MKNTLRPFYNQTDYYKARIEALTKYNAEKQDEIDRLISYVVELCDQKCPEEYKQVVLREITKY